MLDLAFLERTQYVSFASAGTLGVLYDGAINAMEDVLQDRYARWKAGVRGVAGCSAGAIAALLFLLDVPRARRRELQDQFDVTRLVHISDVELLLRHYGVSDMTQIERLVETILVDGGMSPYATMRDVGRFLRVDFVVVATNLHTQRAERITPETHPEVPVSAAVCASCAIPFAFRPVRIRDQLMVDGFLQAAQPDAFDTERTPS